VQVGRLLAVVDVESALQAQVSNIESTYGKSMEQWFGVIDQSGLTKHNDVVSMLKADHDRRDNGHT
jgi:hypothetical protein